MTLRIMTKKPFSIVALANQDGCFDLQFRKDSRKERTGSPTYYRWTAQFVITAPKANAKELQKVRDELECGSVTLSGSQARFSVQNIGDIAECILPYFTRHALAGEKKKDFELWRKAVCILVENKGKSLLAWKKNDINSLLQIHASSLKYKKNSRSPKWMSMAKTFAKSV